MRQIFLIFNIFNLNLKNTNKMNEIFCEYGGWDTSSAVDGDNEDVYGEWKKKWKILILTIFWCVYLYTK